jgi:hypothetical protein
MHPRPHLRRSAWLDLDGAWSFALDPTDRGEREGWFRGRSDWPATIVVPFPWESPRAGLVPARTGDYVRGQGLTEGGIGWYARRLEIPPAWAGERVWLVVGAAYWRTRVWIDGVLATEHEGGYDPFEVDITDLVAGRSTAELAIRVWAPPDTDEYPHGKNTRHWYSGASGIWQAVFLEPRPATHVERLRATADLAGSRLAAMVEVRSNAPGEVAMTLELLLDGAVVARDRQRFAVMAGVTTLRRELAVAAPRPWSLDDPALYDLRVTVEGTGTVADVVETTVGFRTVAFDRPTPDRPRRLLLNGQPLYLRAVMSQGYHPDGILAYPDEGVIRRDLESAKRLGFNMVRLHVKLEDPRVLAWADRLGILLWCEVPNFLTPSDDARRRWEQVWRAMLERDAGHPSIALWCMFIESWGLGTNQFGFGAAERAFSEDPEAQAWVEAMYRLGKSLDDTRPIIENSVSEADHTIAEVNDVHLFPLGYGELREVAGTTLDAWLGQTRPGASYNFAPGYVQGDQPLMVSSMAGWSSVDGVETSWPLRVLLNEIRARDRICGYGWVQLYDVEWELTGLQTYDRRPKALGVDVAEINADDALVVLGPLARLARAGDTLTFEVALADGCGQAHQGLTLGISAEGIGSRWEPITEPSRSRACAAAVEGSGVTPLGVIEIALPDDPFAGLVWLELTDDRGARVARTFVNVATGPVDEPAGPGATDLPLSGWRDETGEPPRAVLVHGRPERIDGSALAFDLPEGAVPDGPASVVLEAEVAVWADGQLTEADPEAMRPIEVRLDGLVVAQPSVPRLHADSSASLSIVHPEGLGTHGARLAVALGRAAALAGGGHRITLRASAGAGERIVLFGPNLGMAPVGPRLLL